MTMETETKRPRGRPAGRKLEQCLVFLAPDDIAALDALVMREGEASRSGAIRRLVRQAVRKMEAEMASGAA